MLAPSANFAARKVSIHVVFFTRNERSLWRHSPLAAAARRIVLALLQQQQQQQQRQALVGAGNSRSIVLHTQYEHAGDRAWLAFTAPLSFVFVTTYTFAPSCEVSSELKALLEAQTLVYLTWVRCASLLELTFSDANAYGFITKQSYAPVEPLIALLLRAYDAADAAASATAQQHQQFDAATADQFATLLSEARGAGVVAPHRLALTALIGSLLLRAGADRTVTRAWTIAVAAASALPLEARAALHPASSGSYPASVLATSSAILRCAASVFDTLAAANAVDNDVAVAFADVFDGRFLHVTLSFIAHNTAKDEDSAASLFAWQHACTLAGAKADDARIFDGVPALSESDAPSSAAPIDPVPPEQRQLAAALDSAGDADLGDAGADPAAGDADDVPPLLPLVGGLGRQLAGSDAVDALTLLGADQAVALSKRATAAGIAFAKATNWKGCEYILNEGTNLLLKAKEDKERLELNAKQQVRHKQKFLAFQQRYAASLEGTTALAGKRSGPLIGTIDAALNSSSADANDDAADGGDDEGGDGDDAADDAADDKKKKKAWAGGAGGGAKAGKPSRADVIRASNARKREVESQQRELLMWTNFKMTLSGNATQARREMIDFAKARSTQGVRALVYDHMIERLIDQRRHHAQSQQKRLRLAVQMTDAIKIVSQLVRRAVLSQWREDQAAELEASSGAAAAGKKPNPKAKPKPAPAVKKGAVVAKGKDAAAAAAAADGDAFALPELVSGVPSALLVAAMARAAETLRALGFDCTPLIEDEATDDELMLVGLRRADADEAGAGAAAAAAAAAPAPATAVAKKMTKTKAAAVAAAAAAAATPSAPKSTALVYLLPALRDEMSKVASKFGKHTDLASVETKAGDLLRFQLAHMGHLMDVGGAPNPPDSRVAFTPDAWQRTLLDVVDRRASAVIVAPTSSGKTFISYYAMKAVAVDISKPNGTVVFVVPTKALVNQVAAQVYYTFGDKFGILMPEYRHNLDSCRFLVTVADSLAMLLRSAERVQWTQRIRYAVIDEAHFIGAGVEGVPVEACFTMLQCPILALSATIGNPQELRAWMQTVEETKKARFERDGEDVDYSFEVATVPGADDAPIHRHADLQKFVFLPKSVQSKETYDTMAKAHKAVDAYNALVKADDAKAASAGAFVGFDLPKDADALDDERARRADLLVPMNPLAAASLGPGRVGSKAVLPRQLTLSPPEVMSLFDTMVEVVKAQEAGADREHVLSALKELRPAKVLGRGFVTRSAVRGFEDTLQALLRSWLDGVGAAPASGAAGAAFAQRIGQAVLAKMRSELDKRAANLNDDYLAQLRAAAKHGTDVAVNKGVAPHPSSFEFLETHVLSLLIALERADQLPVLVFHESGNGCERLCEAVVVALERLEVAREGETDAAKEAKLAKKLEKARKKAEDAATKKKTVGNKAEDNDDKDDDKDEAAGGAGEDLLDPAAQHISPAFSFVRAQLATLTPNGVDEMITHAVGRSKLLQPNSVLVRALRRGIGVHHYLAEKKYREAVELLYRSRYIQVVFCTSSLAYGIHMPCRTVVFAADSLSLSALEFNQMAGRAGRRGYDLIGNVVFFGLPLTRVRALVAADVPSLEGVAPAVSSLALRAALLTRGQTELGEPDEAVRRLARLMHTSLQTPFFALKSPERVRQLRERFCFALDALCRYQMVLEADGTPLPLSGLQLFLSDSEQSAAVFVRMLRSGVLHRMCTTSRSRNTDSVMYNLLLVLSHLFNRQALSTVQRLIALRLADEGSALHKAYVAEEMPVGSVALQPLPASLRRAIVAHDRDALREASAWARFTARRLGAFDGQHRSLPLTGAAFAPLAEPAKAGGALAAAAVAAAQRAPPAPVRSPFAALSRRGDDFVSPSELKSAARRDLATDCNGFVSQWISTDAAGRAIPGNAYNMDMFRHGVPDAAVRQNGIEQGEVWFTLTDAARFFEVLNMGIELHCKERSPRDQIFVALGPLIEHFKSRANKFWA